MLEEESLKMVANQYNLLHLLHQIQVMSSYYFSDDTAFCSSKIIPINSESGRDY